MFAVRMRCDVIEVPVVEDPQPVDEGSWPRDLLPWADPYIASLMLKLNERYGDVEYLLDDELALYRLAADEWLGDGSGSSRLESASPVFPPVYGGFPLLDDVARE